MKLTAPRTIIIGVLLVVLGGCDANIPVNQHLRVEDGEVHRGGLSTVNGSIYIGKNSRVIGDCRSVNGRVEIRDGAEVQDVTTVNGEIEVGENVLVAGNLATVNGGIYLASGTEVKENIATVNGKIELINSVVNGEVTTVNGNIEMTNGAVIKENIIVKTSKGSLSGRPHIKIRLENGAVVEGDIIAEDPDSHVTVYLSGGSRVLGKIENAELLEQ